MTKSREETMVVLQESIFEYLPTSQTFLPHPCNPLIHELM